ncbi:hypothetical protein MMC30_006334 [Trapelia coarctata]|nr:hypothetical protein [Trapelia coarctata]
MASNNLDRLGPNGFARPRAQSLSSLRILQSSDSIPLITQWDTPDQSRHEEPQTISTLPPAKDQRAGYQTARHPPPANPSPANPSPPPAESTGMAPNSSSTAPQTATGRSSPTQTWEEWKSWKIGWPWLSFLLVVTVSLVLVIAALDVVSRRNSGFVRLSDPPAFFTHNPALERAIWSQGILYTALPAFFMTVYRTMWESSVTAFADRQPYVDLKRHGGRPLRSTIMLDYKAEPYLYGWVQALRNSHLLLAACMLCSVVLTLLVVPLASFLFTTASFASNTTLPLSFETSFNSNILGEYPLFPELRLPLDSAAAMHIQDASRPPWTDGEYAFPKFIPVADVGDGNITLETTAYSARSDCVYIQESQYRKTVLKPGDTGIPALMIQIDADDRGCQISHAIDIRLTREAPNNILRIWATMSCSADAGWSRFSILTAHHTGTSTEVTNFSLISCKPSYWIAPGTLVATAGSISAPSLKDFAPHPSNTSQFRPDALWRFFEMGIQDPGCFDPLSNVASNEFGRYMYKIAYKKNPVSPLLPGAIIDAAQTLFTTTFAVFASTALFKPTSSPLDGTGVYSVEETRLIVVSPIAYIILGVLSVVAILNISLFFYTRQKSMLSEEPVGLLSIAWILHDSVVNTMVADLAKGSNFNGKTKEPAMRNDQKIPQHYYFDKNDGTIRSSTPPQPSSVSRFRPRTSNNPLLLRSYRRSAPGNSSNV